jgi:hypothetical protein
MPFLLISEQKLAKIMRKKVKDQFAHRKKVKNHATLLIHILINTVMQSSEELNYFRFFSVDKERGGG